MSTEGWEQREWSPFMLGKSDQNILYHRIAKNSEKVMFNNLGTLDLVDQYPCKA